jgi:hypothetical protein
MLDKQLAFTISDLSLEQVNLILGALSELPFKVSSPLISKIQADAQRQIDAAQAPEPTIEEAIG